jgi:hypothetical protein
MVGHEHIPAKLEWMNPSNLIDDIAKYPTGVLTLEDPGSPSTDHCQIMKGVGIVGEEDAIHY